MTSEAPVVTSKPPVVVDPSAPEVKVSTMIGGGISQTYEISAKAGTSVDLSKLKIRFNYTKDGSASQTFWCDCAGLQMNVAPYYVAMASDVKGTFGNGYLDITFDSDEVMTGGSLTLGVRFNQSDWSAYSNFVAGSYEIIYDGVVVDTIEA